MVYFGVSRRESGAAAEQIVGPERRERVSHLDWTGEGCVDTRRPVNCYVGCLAFSWQHET